MRCQWNKYPHGLCTHKGIDVIIGSVLIGSDSKVRR